MTKKNMIIIAVVLIVGFTIYKCVSVYNAEIHKNDVDTLNYTAERLLSEGGFEAAKEYANSIFGESYCVAEGLVYNDALEEMDLPNRQLLSAIFCPSETQNHLYLYYTIPTKKAGSNRTATFEFVNLSRDTEGVFHCTTMYIYTNAEEANKLMEEALDTNAANIELDAIVKKQIDYGILYNVNPNYYNLVFTAEKNRLTNYLLSVQRDRQGAYQFSTNPEINGVENIGSYIIDIDKYFLSEIPAGIKVSISGNKAVSDNSVSDNNSVSNNKESVSNNFKVDSEKDNKAKEK